MTKVMILDINQRPLFPVRISRARMLLSQGQASVFQRYPFTIILKEHLSHPKLEQLGLKVDPDDKSPSTVVNKGKKLSMSNSRFPKRGL